MDDHPNTANMLARAIAQLGPKVEVVSATSGRQALDCVKDGAVDILITDMIMPEMTGLELIEELQKHPAGRPTFSFLVTAYDVPGLKITARRLNVKEVLLKPIHPQRICQIVSSALDEMDRAKPSSEDLGTQKRFNILIADDKPDNITLLSRYIESEGLGYITARDGLETLEKVRSQCPDLVLLDINMPYKDGFEVLQEVRADPATQHIPVIILTAARLDAAEIQYGLNLGADDYVTKPFDRRELLARIRTKLRVKEAEDVIRRRNRELNLLPEIGRALSARLNIEELTTILLKRTAETLGAMLGYVIIFGSGKIYQKVYRLSAAAPTSAEGEKYSLPDGLLEAINSNPHGLIVDDISKDPLWQGTTDQLSRSAVVVPMFGSNHLLGILVLTNEQPNYFNLEHLLLLQAITSQASIGVENAQLYASLQREQQHLSAVLRNAADAILLFDATGCLSLINPAGEKLFTDYEAKLGKQLTVGAGYDSFLQLIDQARLSNASFSGEVAWPDKRVFSASITPVQEGGYVAVLHDVSRFKELEKVKDEFIAIASHDLKNPIAAISGFSQLLKQAGPLNEMQNDFVQRIQKASSNMSELVQNIVDLARIDLGAETKKDQVGLSDLLRELADEFKPQAQVKKHSLTIEEIESEVRVAGDAQQLRQALRNLIGNAIKYTPDGGVITLSLKLEANRAHISVRDTGYGIPPSEIPHVFDRFYRVQNNGHDHIEGNGLGLAIVKSIIEQHGGQVALESEAGKGSCFSVLLPLMQQSTVPVHELNCSNPGSGHDFRQLDNDEKSGFHISMESTK